MVKSDPFSGLRYVGGFMGIGGIGGAMWVTVVRGGDIGSSAALLVMALRGAAIFWRLFPWAPVEKRRQAAARQENTVVSLAAEHPVGPSAALDHQAAASMDHRAALLGPTDPSDQWAFTADGLDEPSSA